MASKNKRWVGSAASVAQVWSFSPPVSGTAPTWSLTLNGKTLSVLSNGSASDAVAKMLTAWSDSQEPEFLEITPSVPTPTSVAGNPGGGGTNEILAIWISGAPTGGSFQLQWGGSLTPFLADPQTAPGGSDAGSAGNLNGTYEWTMTCLNVNPFGQIGETLPTPLSAPVTLTNHMATVSLPTFVQNPAANQICVGRRLYRTTAGGSQPKLVWTIWDNTTTTYPDNTADGSLGANQPTSNTTGIPFNASATQVQSAMQSLASVGSGNFVASGSGTAASPWLCQFTGILAAKRQSAITAGAQSFSAPTTVPASIVPKVFVSEIQQGVTPNATPPSDGNTLLLVGTSGQPFYATSTVSGVIPPAVKVTTNSQNIPTPTGQVQVIEQPAGITVKRTTIASAGVNEGQQIQISPNALSGSTFTLSWGGQTTGAIPTPPAAPSAVSNGAGNLGASTTTYYWGQTFLTAKGETEMSLPSAGLSLGNQQATVTISTGASAVTARRVYRAAGSPLGPYYLVGTVSDNTTTSFSDNLADATIAINPPPPATNGCLHGELEALSSIGQGNIKVACANAGAFSGMSLANAPVLTSPPLLSTATITNKPPFTSVKGLANWGALSTGTYVYQLTALDATGETLPGASSNVSVTGPTGAVYLTWSAVSNAKGYKIYRNLVGNANVQLVAQVGPSITSYFDYGSSPAPITYLVTFIGTLGKAPQSLISGNASNVNILPTVTMTPVQQGFAPQSSIQVVGWTQQYGNGVPSGTWFLSVRILNQTYTTAGMAYNVSSAGVLSAIQAVIPQQYAQAVTVFQLQSSPSSQAQAVGQSFNLFSLSFTGALAFTDVPQALADITGMVPASGDSVTAINQTIAKGSPVGRNAIWTATVNNAPNGGTFGLAANLADGNSLSATGIAYNASAATVQAAFPAATVSVSGSDGGPYTIELVGEAGQQAIWMTATSNLTASGGQIGSPPTVNTAGLPAPTVTATAGTGGALATGTYYYKVTTVTGSGGESNSPEYAAAVTGPTGSVALTWSAVTGANSYNIYRGTTPGGENVKIAGGINTTAYTDFGGTNITQSPPTVNTASISPPGAVLIHEGGVSGRGILSPATTYFYKITAVIGGVETVPTFGDSITSGQDEVFISWTAVPGAASYNIYRGTSAGGENLLIASTSGDATAYAGYLTFCDSGPVNTSQSPPGSNTATVSAPTLVATPGLSSSGNLSNVAYFYKITALTAAGETTGSIEATATSPSAAGIINLTWNVIPGATGYNIYRGTSTGAENTLIATINDGTATEFNDANWTPSSHSPPGSGGAAPGIPTITKFSNVGAFPAATYYYKVTASTGGGETLPSLEVSIAVSSKDEILLTMPSSSGISGFTGWNVYRGTGAGAENVRIATNTTQTNIYDTNELSTGASPPGSNTATLPAPIGQSATAQTQAGQLISATYYYKVTAVNANGETTQASEFNAVITGPTGLAMLSWTAVPGATSYNIYRGTVSGSENVLIASTSNTAYWDAGGTHTTQSPPGSGITLSAPIQTSVSGPTAGGAFASAQVFYVVTALNANGETVKSNEQTGFAAGFKYLTVNWQAVPGATGYRIYRGTATGSETVLVGTVLSSSATSFSDSNPSNVSASPPVLNGALIATTIQGALTPSASGGTIQSGTYFYVVTATTAAGETTVSNEESTTVTGPTGSVSVQWNLVLGATGFRVYRGTSAGGENLLVAIITSGSTTTYTDTTGTGIGLKFTTTEVFAGALPQNDTQQITLTNAGGGTYTAAFGNQIIKNIPWNATAAALQNSFALLANVGANNVLVTETVNNGVQVYTVSFIGALATLPQDLIVAYATTAAPPPAISTTPVVFQTSGYAPIPAPSGLSVTAQPGGVLASGAYFYAISVVTSDNNGTVSGNGESVVSQQVFGTTDGVVVGDNGTMRLTWNPVNFPDVLGYNVYRGIIAPLNNYNGQTSQPVTLLTFVKGGLTAQFDDDGTFTQATTLLGGSQYNVILSAGATDNFTLSFGGQTTVSISPSATANTVTSDLQALSTIGGGNATAILNSAGNWTILIAPSIVPTGTLSATMNGISTVANYQAIFYLDVEQAIGGTFLLNYGPASAPLPSSALSYNASASQVQASLASIVPGGSNNVTVTGQTGGPWIVTITANAQTLSYAMSGDPTGLVGVSGSLTVYPVTYCYATGPNWYDEPKNWADGSVPAFYLATPVISSVAPISTDSTLQTLNSAGNLTHGSLTTNQTYYYQVTALNANGETVGSTEQSGLSIAGAYFYLNGTATAGTYTLSYGGQTATIPYNDTASQIQTLMQALTSIGSGNCSVTGLGTQASPFVFVLAGTKIASAPTPLTANSAGLTGATVSVRNFDTRTLLVSWNEVYGATGYNVYRGTSSGGENVLVATLSSRDATSFADDGTYTTSSASPPTDTNSYHTAVGDSVYLTNNATSVLYGIAASVVNGYSVHGGFRGLNYGQLNSLTIDATFTGRVGLSRVNGGTASNGYNEYRPIALTVQGPPSGTFPVVIGNGTGNGSSLISLDTGTCQVAGVCNFTAQAVQDPAALLWIGNTPSGEWDLFSGSMAIGIYPDQTWTLGTIRQAYQTNVESDTALEIGPNGTLTTLNKNGGTTIVHCPVTTLTAKAGTVTQDLGTVGTLDVESATYISRSTGTITTLKVSGTGKFDRSQDSRPLTITNPVNLYVGATFLDPHGSTDSGGLTLNLVECRITDVTLDLGSNVTLVRTQN